MKWWERLQGKATAPTPPVMRAVENQTFFGRATQSEYRDLSLDRCTFHACYLPFPPRPGEWNHVKSLAIRDANQINCSLDGALIEDVTLHNLKRTGDAPLFFWGCVFRRVTLSGNISGLKINRSISVGAPARATMQPEWDRMVRQHYDATDWALDISNASFGGGVSFEALPGDKIRRDPETQILVRRSTLAEADWESLDYQRTAINIELGWFLGGSQFDSVVLAARMGSKSAKQDLAVFRSLREAGIAEPD
jgi:hypothetical protein